MMRVETSKDRMYSKALEEKAIEFHGHGGPFMVIGLRVGLTALNMLDTHGWFDLKCKAYLKWAPPDSCVIDGIQTATGCTMGKHNIEVIERPGVTAEFTSQGKRIRMQVKEEVMSHIRNALGRGEPEIRSLMDTLVTMSDIELFEISTMSTINP